MCMVRSFLSTSYSVRTTDLSMKLTSWRFRTNKRRYFTQLISLWNLLP